MDSSQARATAALALGILASSGTLAARPATPGDPGAIPPAAPPRETLFIQARKLIPKPGVVVENAAVIVRDGRIVAAGPGLSAPEGARVLEGAVVCSAFLDPWAALGMSPDSLADGNTGAATRGLDGFDPYGDDHLREEALAAGVTVARVHAGATARASGLGALVRLAPGLPEADVAILDDCGVAMSVGLSANAPGPRQRIEFVDGELRITTEGGRAMDPFDRIADVDRVVGAVDSGKTYLESKIEYRYELEEWQKKIAEKEAELQKDFKKAQKDREKAQKEAEEKDKKFEEKKYKEDKKPSQPRWNEDNEVMARVANGEVPLVVQAHRAAEIRELLSGTAAHDRLRLVVAGGTEALASADELKERRVPVIVWPALLGRERLDELEEADLSLAGQLDAQGVHIAIGTGGLTPAASRDLPLLAMLAVSGGLARDKAFAAITLGAAQVLDAAERLGSVEVGKDAEILVLDGDPLSAEGRVRWVVSDGRVVVEPGS